MTKQDIMDILDENEIEYSKDAKKDELEELLKDLELEETTEEEVEGEEEISEEEEEEETPKEKGEYYAGKPVIETKKVVINGVKREIKVMKSGEEVLV